MRPSRAGVSARLASLFARVGAALVRVAPDRVRDCSALDVGDTIEDVCLRAYGHGGWPALVWNGICECADVARSATGARLNTSRLSVQSGQPPGTPAHRKGWTTVMIDDLRHALRRLRSRPALLATIVAMLGVAIGVTVAMFTVVDALILHPAPFRDPAHLVQVKVTVSQGVMNQVTPVAFRAMRQSPAFSALQLAGQSSAVIEGGAEPVTRAGARVTVGLFEMLGARPLAGRTFVAGEGRAGTDDRALISEDLWRAQFGADPQIIGKRIRLSGESVEVIGIMPADFRFPFSRTSVWRPIDMDAPPQVQTSQPMAFARLAAGLSQAEAATITTDTMHRADPATAELGVRFDSIAKNYLDPYSVRAVTALGVGVGLVFLALCANALNLLLTRLTARRREFGVCSALGASRGRLLRQALTENLVIGSAGSLVGLAISAGLVALARSYLPEAFLLRTLNPINLDVRAVTFASLAGVIAVVLAGIAPAWIGTGGTATGALDLRERATTESRIERTFTRGLLVAEIALAVALLLGAGLLLRSFVNLTRADRGLDSTGVIVGGVSLPPFAFADRPSRFAFAESLDSSLRSLHGVSELALSYGMPPSWTDIYFGQVEADSGMKSSETVELNAYAVDNDYFALYRLRLREGRLFQPSDSGTDVVVGEALARRYWPNASAVGHTFTIGGGDSYRVVGVVNEVRSPSNDPRTDSPEIYRPLKLTVNGQVVARAFGSGQVNFSLRCAPACPTFEELRQRIHSVNARAVVDRLEPLDDEFMTELARPRAAAALALVFAILTTLAAAGGLFSVFSYAVSRRLREFGIRSALGGQPRQIRRHVIGDATRITAAGLSIGVFAAWLVARSLASLEFGVTAADPLTWATVVAVLAATTLLSTWRPARQASRVDPVRLLRDA